MHLIAFLLLIIVLVWRPARRLLFIASAAFAVFCVLAVGLGYLAEHGLHW